MRGQALVILCALALAKAGTVRRRTFTNNVVNSDPKQAAAICAASESNGFLVAHEHCNHYYQCWNGQPEARSCYGDLNYNPTTEVCDWPHNVDCGDRIIPENSEEHGLEDTVDVAALCSSEGSEDLLIAHKNCDKFYKCHESKPVAYKCPGHLLYNSDAGYCDCASSVACGDRIITNEDNQTVDGSEQEKDDIYYDEAEASSICAKEESYGMLVAHEICNKFYKCSHNQAIEFACYGNLLFDPVVGHCDWPENVECGKRIICTESEDNNTEHDGDNGNTGSDENKSTDNGDSGTCKCNPGEAKNICSTPGSDGTLIAHENCNKFYQCVHGQPVVQKCNGVLLYNPYKEVCDWPDNVECGDRTISEESEEESIQVSGEENENTDDGESGDAGSGDAGSGTCNCHPGEAKNICSVDGSDGTLIAHENCNKFYQCVHGHPVVQKCNGVLLYNPYKEVCDWPDNVECGDRTISEESEEESIQVSGEENENTDDGDSGNAGSGTCNCNPGEAKNICLVDGSDGTLIAHENCNKFYQCVHGHPVVQKCNGDLLYNPYKEVCDWPDNVECGDRTISEESEEESIQVSGEENENTDDGDSDNAGSGTCNCNPGEAKNICSVEGSDGTLIAHENCNKFYQCVHGHPVVQKCNGVLLYNPYKEVCDWPDNVECGDRTISEESEEESIQVSGEENGNTDDGNSGNVGSGTCNCNPGEAKNICSVDGSDGTLIAHENCNKFYQCVHGHPVVQKCNGVLLYNPYKEVCDWPDNVECGERTISEESEEESIQVSGEENGNTDDGDSGNAGSGTCNCNPGEAKNICSVDGSDGTLIAHENCNKFYQCVHGHPVVQKCNGVLLYNPYKEVCDWPDNVECGNRTISEESEEESMQVSGEENGNTDDGDSGNAGSGTCNCNPGEAKNICSVDGSDGTLIAHENCNKFYQCVHGHPVVQKCNGVLLYNPHKEVCDWPDNVECGDRTISEESEEESIQVSGEENENTDDGDSDNAGSGTCNCNPGEAKNICSVDGSDGTLIAHENCNKFYQCVHGHPVVQKCNGVLLYNPYKEVCDWPDNVECGNRTISEESEEESIQVSGEENGNTDDGDSGNVGSGTCNCNPGEAKNICSVEGSDGTLIAHENCNKFYQCVHGEPVVQKCNGALLYNPYKEVCDWPDNVECGDRTISEDSEEENEEECSEENGNTDDGDSGNGGSGSCNCNPGEAKNICSVDGSDGTLIAHQNCNKFYQCVHGEPVVQKCNGALLYNPHKEVCDWPDNVECGDRTISKDSDEENEEECSEENRTTDSEDSVIGGSGTCNCNPGEAKTICSETGSDGTLIAHEDCDKYYQCVHGLPIVQECINGLLYNPYEERCDWSNHVECGNRIIPVECEDGTDHDQSDIEETSGECLEDQAYAICASESSEGTFVPHENCNQFYVCVSNQPVVLNCSGVLLYNSVTNQCDWPVNVDCGNRLIPEDCEEDDNNVESEDTDDNNNLSSEECYDDPTQAPAICASENSEGIFVAHENCHQFYVCVSNKPVVLNCSGILLYNPVTKQCDWPENVDCGDRLIITEDCENDNSDAENGGAENENAVNKPCNCNPDEATHICSIEGSDGTLIAHEDCDKYYQCVHGVPFVQKCTNDLLYNPYNEVCDWSLNVDCGNRTVPVPEDDCDDSNVVENGSSSNEDKDYENNEPEDCDGDSDADSNSENEGNDNKDENEDESANNNDHKSDYYTDTEALTHCQTVGTNAFFIPHQNCNQFYVCVGNLPVILNCTGDLLFNEVLKECDVGENVECGNRYSPKPDDNNLDSENEEKNDTGNENNKEDIENNANESSENNDIDSQVSAYCALSNSEEKVLPHENCNQYYICISGEPVLRNCSGQFLFNTLTLQCDWPQNVNCDRATAGGASDNNKEEIEDEKEAIDISVTCSQSGNDGLALPHENCNQYYLCVGGKPEIRICSGQFLFNPELGHCDWPQNVKCN